MNFLLTASARICPPCGVSRALTASGSMAETETRLAQDSFFRGNKGCLVNLEHVDCMDGEDAVVHGERVPIARARRKAFLDALNDYINGAG